MIIKSYFEEIILLLMVLSICICSVIFTSRFSNDYEEKKCVDFYIKNNYITHSCEIYRKKLEEL